MKKRWIAVLLCAALLAAFGWGQPRISGEGETYDLYFLEADLSDAPGGDALRAEPLYIESGEVRDTRELAEYLVTELLAGPEDAALTSAIPEETTLLSLELDGTRAKVDLSSRYRLLSGVALALADYAITLTLTQLPENLRCQRDGPGPAAGLPGPANLHSQGCPVFQQRGCDRHAERHPVLSG